MPIHPLVAIVTLLALLVYLYMGVLVGQGRTKFGVEAPATTGNPDFERLYRVQMNTLEWLPLFLVSLWLFAVSWNADRVTAAIGLVWIVGRILYLTGYSKAAASRSLGFLIQMAATAVLLFGALGRIYGDAARRSITGITLIAGFASTVGWPLTAWGLDTIGWRDTCLAWAAAHILFGLPLNYFMLPAVQGAKAQAAIPVKPHIPIDRTMILLAFAFAAAWSVTGAMAAHLPRILQAAGATTLQAVSAGALIGPAQVLARIVEASFLSRYHPVVSTRIACLMHPIGAAILALAGGGAASAFAIFHGAGNGILTIARGTLPLAIFGTQNYGYRLGIIGAPARMAQAAAPLAFGLLIDTMGSRVLIVSSALSLAALLALCLLRQQPAAR